MTVATASARRSSNRVSRFERTGAKPRVCKGLRPLQEFGTADAVRPASEGRNYLGKSVRPIRNRSTERAAWRPSRMAQTTSDWPRRMSPAANTFLTEVW